MTRAPPLLPRPGSAIRAFRAPPVPAIKYLQGTYVWQARSPAASPTPTPETGSFAAVASGDTAGQARLSPDRAQPSFAYAMENGGGGGN